MTLDLEEMLRRANEDLERKESEFQAAQARLEASRTQMEELRAMRDGAQKLVERYGDAGSAAIDGAFGSADPGEASQAERAQTDRCLDVLGELGKPTNTAELHQILPDLDFEQVRSAMGYLLRKGRVKRVGKATWALPEWSLDDDFAPAVYTAGANKAGENGTSSQGGVLTGADLPHIQ